MILLMLLSTLITTGPCLALIPRVYPGERKAGICSTSRAATSFKMNLIRSRKGDYFDFQ